MESKFARIIKTFTFRLALVYVGLFSLSVILLFGFIYSFAMNYLQTQITESLKLQYYYLLNEYRTNGSDGLEDRVKELIAKDEEGTGIYILANRDFEPLAGTLTAWPQDIVKEAIFEKEGFWVRFLIEDPRGRGRSIEVKAIMAPLSKWRWFIVGQTLQSNERIEQTIVQTFWASLTVTLIMAFIGAIIMTRSVMRRLSIINRAAGTIMHGHLSARIPYTRGGDEFDDLSANLNLMLDTIENLLESLSQFANNIAHDLRGPLNRIINRLDAGLRSIERANPAHTLLEKNIHDLEDLVGTFNSILKITELEANTEFRQFEPCDLHRILDNLVEFYEPYATDKHITLTNSIDGTLIIDGEKNLLTQAFSNLIDNAIKFTPQGGTITLSMERFEDHDDIVIADSGLGIAEVYRNKVFEKFFRLEQSRHTKGNGLGLSMVAAIARIHNITIALDDNNPGLKVRLSFLASKP
ncbi:MAG: HAMP domain-containing sensor histidine kinase [Rickettsiales bacterium]|nr:HAMP domain-containing sensor histidine kinase [Rickettsiales bacterium]